MMSVKYEVIELYYGNWSGCCGRYDNLQDAIEKLKVLSNNREDVDVNYRIFVKIIEEEK